MAVNYFFRLAISFRHQLVSSGGQTGIAYNLLRVLDELTAQCYASGVWNFVQMAEKTDNAIDPCPRRTRSKTKKAILKQCPSPVRMYDR